LTRSRQALANIASSFALKFQFFEVQSIHDKGWFVIKRHANASTELMQDVVRHDVSDFA
jgi:hypothetical protein